MMEPVRRMWMLRWYAQVERGERTGKTFDARAISRLCRLVGAEVRCGDWVGGAYEGLLGRKRGRGRTCMTTLRMFFRSARYACVSARSRVSCRTYTHGDSRAERELRRQQWG